MNRYSGSNPAQMSAANVEAIQHDFIWRVYRWMSVGLCITGLLAMGIASDRELSYTIISNRTLFYVLMFGELGLVFVLSGMIQRMSAFMAISVFFLYAALNGVTMSVIFSIYSAESIASAFFVTAGTFAVMSFYGYVTKRDLTSLGNLLFMALIGLVIASVVNIFLNSAAIYWVTTYAGVLIFVGLTAYDTQKIKRMNIIGNEGTEEDTKEAILGALILYLDFINLFLMLLRVMGGGRRK
jgi:uncharacterized protein